MLMHKELFNPINKTAEMSDDIFYKYIEIHDNQSKPTSPELVTAVKEDFYNSHTDISEFDLDKIWAFMEPKVQQNEALPQFILDFGGAKSDYFFPWLLSVTKSPSRALELSYGAGHNLRGNWIRHIPESDEITYFVRNAPTLAYNRERQLRVADLVKTDREIAIDNQQVSKVVDLGAGRLAWARHHGLRFKPRLQSISAFDVDQTINPGLLFPWPLASRGIYYEHRDIKSVLQDQAITDISLSLLNGVASYYPTDLFREGFVRPLYYKLRQNGKFFFDLQLAHLAYIWSVKTFDWPEMKLPAKASEAIDIVENLRKTLWRDGLKFSAEYTLDTYNESPLSVMVLLVKI